MHIHCQNHDEADRAWQWLQHIPDHLWQPVELHLHGYGCLYLVTRSDDGEQLAVRPSAPAPHTLLP